MLADGWTIGQVLVNLKRRVRSFPSPFEQAVRIRGWFPDLAARIQKNTETIMDGFFHLPGNPDDTFIGNPPRWHDDPYHTPEYVYQLNRMNHWLPILYTFYFTNDETYARRLLAEMEDWIEKCPAPSYDTADATAEVSFFNSAAAKEWRVLECGIRCYRTWEPVLIGLCLADLLTEDNFGRILESFHEQCGVIAHVSPLAWPRADHNHFLMENLGLLAISCLLPEFQEAAAWKSQAMDGLIRAIKAQVTEDGGQVEGCPSYHNGCIFWFAQALAYGRRYHLAFPDQYIERFSKMAEYSLYTTRPSGSNVPWGDTGTRTGTLVKAAVSTFLGTGDTSYIKLARCFYSYDELLVEVQEHLFRMDHLLDLYLALKEAEHSFTPPKLPLIHVNRELKQAFLRTGWEQQSLSLFFACRTPVKNLHAHIDPCGFDFTAYGIPMVVDPGRYTYKDGPDREHFKTMAWHNTLMLNHKNAWEYLGSWAYGPQKEGDIVAAGSSAHSVWVMGKHENYAPALHTRAVLLIDNTWMAVLDFLEHVIPKTPVQLQFHVDRPWLDKKGDWFYGIWEPEERTKTLPDGLPEKVQASQAMSRSCFLCSTLKRSRIVSAMVSDFNDQSRPSSIVRYETDCSGQTLVAASAIYPALNQMEAPELLLSAELDAESGYPVLSAELPGRHYQFVMKPEGIAEAG